MTGVPICAIIGAEGASCSRGNFSFPAPEDLDIRARKRSEGANIGLRSVRNDLP